MAAITHQTTRLGVGRHDGPGEVVCVMELASMLAGERFSDRPVSVCPMIGAILRAYNDVTDDRRRAERTRSPWPFRRPPAEPPGPEDGPDLIAFYVVCSIGRKHSDESHAGMLVLIDRLIAMGMEERVGAPGLGPVLVFCDVVEQLTDTVQDARRDEQLLLAELG